MQEQASEGSRGGQEVGKLTFTRLLLSQAFYIRALMSPHEPGVWLLIPLFCR